MTDEKWVWVHDPTITPLDADGEVRMFNPQEAFELMTNPSESMSISFGMTIEDFSAFMGVLFDTLFDDTEDMV